MRLSLPVVLSLLLPTLLAVPSLSAPWRPSPPEPWEAPNMACAALIEAPAEQRSALIEAWTERAVGDTRVQIEGAKALLDAREWPSPPGTPTFEQYLPVAMSEAEYERRETVEAAARAGSVPITAQEWLDDVAAARHRIASLEVVLEEEERRPGPFARAARRRWRVVDWRGDPLEDADVRTRLGALPTEVEALRRLVYEHNEVQRIRVGAKKPDDKMKKGVDPAAKQPFEEVDYDALFEGEDGASDD